MKTWCIDEALDKCEIRWIIKCSDNAFALPVAERANYEAILDKIDKKGKVIFAYNNVSMGYCAFYANNSETCQAYISLIAVSPEFQNMHIGRTLLLECFRISRNYGMTSCALEVKKSNDSAISFYKKNGFKIISEQDESYFMQCEFMNTEERIKE